MNQLALPQIILQKIRTILPDSSLRYELHEPYFSGNERRYVDECITSGWVSSVGSYVNQFEERLVDFTGARHAIAAVNGTAALHICLLVSGVLSGEEVLVPTLTFVATANAVTYCGAIPHFIDADFDTLGISVDKLERYLNDIALVKNDTCINKKTGRKIAALCVTHIFGHPADLDLIVALCEKFHITLIEDAAEALGSYYKNTHVGNFSAVSALSFNGNKIITTGGGGAILTNNDKLAERARHLTTTAKAQHQWKYFHDEVGYNYRMPNINAALGCAQLECIEDCLHLKRNLANAYQTLFSDVDQISFFQEAEFSKSNYWLNVLLLDSADRTTRDEVLQLLCDNDIICRPIWELMHRLPMYRDCPGMDLSNAEEMQSKIILLPSSPSIHHA